MKRITMKNFLSGTLTLSFIIMLGACISIVTKDYAEAKNCLAMNIYHEACNQSVDGQRAVAFVTMNRLESGIYGETVCDVVYAPKQFSWTWTLSDPSPRDMGAYHMATLIAIDVLKDRIEDNTNGADHYHADYVNPYWATDEYMTKTTTIGNHIFYKAK